MNKFLANMLEDNVPKFNSTVVKGLATEWVDEAKEYINDIIVNNMKSAPAELKYNGLRVMSAKEEYYAIRKTNQVKTVYDMAKYDVFRIELQFSYDGVAIPNRHLYLPFVNEAGIINITDTKYHIIPVLSDTVITPTNKNLFIRLLRAKLLVNRINRNILINDKVFTGEVIYSETIKTDQRGIKDDLGKVVPPLGIYTMAEMGIVKAFRMYLDLDVIISKNGDEYKDLVKTHDVYTTTGIKVRQLKDPFYHPHSVHIYIPKGKRNVLIDNTITAILYTMDILPGDADEMVDIINEKNVREEVRYWKIILSKIIFKNNYTIDRGYNDVFDHFVALKSYIDNLIKDKLAETGMHVETFFDLINVILANYHKWLLESKSFNNNIDNRYLDISYYILYPVIIGINKMIYEISKKANKKKLTHSEVTSIMNNHLKLREFFKIKKGEGVSLALMLVD